MTESRWSSSAGAGRGEEYAARFASLAADGRDMHGEATLCASLAPPGGRVLDAGCGTGRVTIRLAELGFRCVGVDVDSSMLDVAQRQSGDIRWRLLDLTDLDQLDESFDLVVAAGNVVPLLAPGTEAAVIACVARRLVPEALFVSGFGLDAAHLPLDEAPFALADFDAWCADASLVLVERFSNWDAKPFDDGGYAVSVHRLA